MIITVKPDLNSDSEGQIPGQTFHDVENIVLILFLQNFPSQWTINFCEACVSAYHSERVNAGSVHNHKSIGSLHKSHKSSLKQKKLMVNH